MDQTYLQMFEKLMDLLAKTEGDAFWIALVYVLGMGLAPIVAGVVFLVALIIVVKGIKALVTTICESVTRKQMGDKLGNIASTDKHTKLFALLYKVQTGRSHHGIICEHEWKAIEPLVEALDNLDLSHGARIGEVKHMWKDEQKKFIKGLADELDVQIQMR